MNGTRSVSGAMVRLGAVSYLNARPLVYGLERSPRFAIRYDIPSECARLLHAHEIDVGLIPSIEYLRGSRPYWIVPGPAIASRGPVASVALYTRKDPRDIRTIAMDTSSRTSVALAMVLARRMFAITPEPIAMAPDLDSMLGRADAAVIIGDNALFLDVRQVRLKPDATDTAASDTDANTRNIGKIDLGEAWTNLTGLPFVYAVWTGWLGALTFADIELLQHARDGGVAHSDAVAGACFPDSAERRAVARRYLRDNIHYFLGPEEIAGLDTFYRYAAEQGLVSYDGTLNTYAAAEHHGAR